MELFSQAELAQAAAQDVAVVAGNLQKKWRESWFQSLPREGLKNLAILATTLQCVSFGQDKYEQGEHGNPQDDRAVKLETFLCGLELVCTVRDHIYAPMRQICWGAGGGGGGAGGGGAGAGGRGGRAARGRARQAGGAAGAT